MSLPPSYKGIPHHDYATNFKKSITPFFKQLPTLERGEIARISKESGIPKETVRRWNTILQVQPGWSPICNHLGEHLRYFTDEEESAISAYIRDIYIHNRRIFTNREFICVIADAWAEKNRNLNPFPPISISSVFISDFKTRNNFSSRRPHLKRRSAASQQSITTFIARISNLLRKRNKDFILNVDETNWQLVPRGILTWATIGDENVQIDFNANEKESITVVATISANGRKLPLQFIAKGKTSKCEDTQLGILAPDHYRAHSESGWSTFGTFSEYLHHLRRYFPPIDLNGKLPRIYVVLDLYSVHRQQETIDLAKSLDIKLLFIPPSCTDELQPLDRRCFGALKAFAKMCFRERLTSNINESSITKIDAVGDMIDSWERMSPETLKSAWDIYGAETEEEIENPFGSEDENADPS